jgi:serine/threonine-protein kinase
VGTSGVDNLIDAGRPSLLGRYTILGKLGTGGMATVYLANNAGELGFQRLCAIKVLHPHLAADHEFIQMLRDEAQIAALLHHPNVVPIVDLGTHNGILYVAMEYVEGCSLSALARKCGDERPPELLVPIVLDALAGLDAAHSLTDHDGQSLRLVHRDVSPQNILVGIDGTARITDFGIARASSRITSTRPGEIKGKLAYMSPEQVRSGEIDRRSDLFSAGAMLWTLLTGRKLFIADNDAATMHNIAFMDIPPPSTIGSCPPAAFDAVCARALERDPDRRFATAAEMEHALREAGGTLASRRDVGEWIVRLFHDELTGRRRLIRAIAAAPERSSLPSLSKAHEIPTFAPMDKSGKNLVRASSVSDAADTRPAEPSAARHPTRSRVALLLVPIAAAVIGFVGWSALHSRREHRDSDPSVEKPVAPELPAVIAPSPAIVTAPPVDARAMDEPAAPARPHPPIRHAVIKHPTAAAPKSTSPPPPPPAQPPPKPAHWDPDSPVPP